MQASIETLKISAALAGSYSLSANQIGLPMSMFAIHKQVLASNFRANQLWLHPNALIMDQQKAEEENPSNLLDPADFQTFINPKVLGETLTQEYMWEHCLSFPNLRCMVKRPIGIEISYLDEQGAELEQKLYDFHARVFLHELDHLKGRSMMHWNISEGNIDVVSESALEAEEKHQKHVNLMTTVQFYKNKIEGLKTNFGHMFEDPRKFEIQKDEATSQEWKKFEYDRKAEAKMLQEPTVHESFKSPSFSDNMIQDTIRAIRRDKKQAAKQS
jgi:peptide deformylase